MNFFYFTDSNYHFSNEFLITDLLTDLRITLNNETILAILDLIITGPMTVNDGAHGSK